jgi:hypothetical protein
MRRAATTLAAALLAVAVLSFFLPSRNEHKQQFRLAGSLNYVYNGDSGGYALLVVKFPHIYTKRGTQVNRPLYTILGAAIYQPLRLLKPLIPKDVAERAQTLAKESALAEVWHGVDMRDLIMAWIALVIVNCAVAFASLWLFYLALSALFDRSAALALALYPLAQRGGIDAILSPHTSVFNLFIPAFFLYVAASVWPRRRSGVAAAAVLGVAMLGKVIVYPFCNWPYEYLIVRPWRSGWKLAVLSGIAFATPTIIFRLFTRWMGMPSGWDEVDRNRFGVWIWDYLHEGQSAGLLLHWLHNTQRHLLQAAESWAIPLLVCVCLACCRTKNPLFTVPRHLKHHLIVYTLCGFGFWTWSGLIYQRLNVCYSPALVVLLGSLAVRKLQRPSLWLWLVWGLMLLEFAVKNAIGVYVFF